MDIPSFCFLGSMREVALLSQHPHHRPLNLWAQIRNSPFGVLFLKSLSQKTCLASTMLSCLDYWRHFWDCSWRPWSERETGMAYLILHWFLPITTWSGVILNAALRSHSYCVLSITAVSVYPCYFCIRLFLLTYWRSLFVLHVMWSEFSQR